VCDQLAAYLAARPHGPDDLVSLPRRVAHCGSRSSSPASSSRQPSRAGLPHRLRFHDLRHTCASLLIAQGASVKAVQA
jgi:integrase